MKLMNIVRVQYLLVKDTGSAVNASSTKNRIDLPHEKRFFLCWLKLFKRRLLLKGKWPGSDKKLS